MAKPLIRLFQGIKARFGRLEPFWDRVEHGLLALTAQRFRQQNDPYGNAWAPLSPITVMLRRQQSDVPLRDTGRLSKSFGLEANRKQARFGSSMPKEIIQTHMFGAVITPKNAKRLALGQGVFLRKAVIPARPFMPFGSGPLPPKYQKVLNEAMEWFLSGARRVRR